LHKKLTRKKYKTPLKVDELDTNNARGATQKNHQSISHKKLTATQNDFTKQKNLTILM
jgi:hypothetical protein